MMVLPADDRSVIGNRFNNFIRNPATSRGRLRVGNNVAAILNAMLDLAPFELPGIAGLEPLFWKFFLAAIGDDLTEQAMFVSDAVTLGRDLQRRHAFHETGGEAAKAAIAERGVGFECFQLVEIDSEV